VSMLCFTLSPTVAAESPNTVLVGVYVLNVGKVDLSTGGYTVDFYLSMRCAAAKCDLGNFEFMNGRAVSSRLEENSTNERFWRIQADLYENLDLHDYPFDSHTLVIRIEDVSLTTQNLTYAPDPSNSGVDPSVVVVGWTVSGWNQKVVDHYYQVYNQTYSQYIFSVTLHREPTSAFEVFIPVFFLAFIALVAMLMYGKISSVFENRILLTASLLVAAVLFQFSLDSSLPPLGYLTFADIFMLATYVIIVSALITGIMVLRYTHKHDLKKVERIHSLSIRILPAVTVIIYVAIFLRFL